MAGKVPIWFWRLKSAPYGARLPKRTIRAKDWKTINEKPAPVTVLNARIGRQLEQRNNRARKPGSLAGFEGNLKAEQYQYFYGLRSSVNPYGWSMCRICRKTFMNEGERTKHLKRKAGERLSCAMKAIIVCNLLIRDGACVICDTRTEDRKWGLPLCDREPCLTTFMFSEHGKDPFKEAIAIAEKINWPRSKRK